MKGTTINGKQRMAAMLAVALAFTQGFAQQKGSFTDPRDKKAYKTVKIGEQTWMAENLNYNASGSKCYDNKDANCAKTGRLYSWETALKACPAGWHLPSNKEWEALMRYIDGSRTSFYGNGSQGGAVSQKKLAAKSSKGTDDYGFAAMPSGMWGGASGWQIWDGVNGVFDNADQVFLWSRTEGNEKSAFLFNTISLTPQSQASLFSIRCLEGDAAALEKKEAEAKAKAEAEVKAKSEAYVKANGGSFTDPRDKKTYKTIKIGKQTWMAENLNWDGQGGRCYNGKDDDSCKKHGRRYDSERAKKACPAGWHLPNKDEWTILFNAAGGEREAGKTLKALSGWKLAGDGSNGSGTNAFGFSALPTPGSSYGNGDWWSANSGYVSIPPAQSGVSWVLPRISVDTYVRCLQGEEPPINYGSLTDSRDKKTYKTITIGRGTWMAENLNYNAKGSKCYNGKDDNCKKHGRLYDKAAALKACPDGWRLPSRSELDGINKRDLKAKSGWGKAGEDDYGFAALPSGGFRGGFEGMGSSTWFWSSTDSYALGAYNNSIFAVWKVNDSDLFSVRCVKN